ncbi:YlbD family protein [Anoxybacteroides tepidamans]|uniref:YlbD family protein n=1 Tax=Anoxybacteroides tepidamans TaxID=265948 RepID=UPI0004875A9F|nr:YlbD family protein [Anoxybacillus tepidamans]
MEKRLDPSVEQFKQFVKKHPKIIQAVRNGTKTWKQFYEDWYLFGEEDEIWDEYKEEEKKQATKTTNSPLFINKILSTLKNMDPNEMQQHIASVQQAIAAIQSMIGQLQGMKPPSSTVPSEHHPFSFRKD